MLRRLRGKRSARSGYNDVDEEGSAQQDVIYINSPHRPPSKNRSPYTASPPRHPTNSAPVQKKAASPPSSPRQEHYRRQLDRLGRRHQSQQQRNKETQQPVFDSPDDVSKGFTSLTYESSLTGTTNDNNNLLDDYILPSSLTFSTIWEKETNNDFEHYNASNNNADSSTPIKVAEARRSALSIATNARGRQDRTTSNSMQRNTYYKSNPAKQRSTTRTESEIKSARHVATSQPPPPTNMPESRRHDHDYRPTPPQHRKSTNVPNSSKEGNDTIIKVRLPEMDKKKDASPPPSIIASSAQTPKLNNGTNHLITRLLKKHQYQAERSKEKKATMEPLQQADLVTPTTASRDKKATMEHLQQQADLVVAPTASRDHPTEIARKSVGQKPDPESRASAIARVKKPSEQ